MAGTARHAVGRGTHYYLAEVRSPRDFGGPHGDRILQPT